MPHFPEEAAWEDIGEIPARQRQTLSNAAWNQSLGQCLCHMPQAGGGVGEDPWGWSQGAQARAGQPGKRGRQRPPPYPWSNHVSHPHLLTRLPPPVRPVIRASSSGACPYQPIGAGRAGGRPGGPPQTDTACPQAPWHAMGRALATGGSQLQAQSSHLRVLSLHQVPAAAAQLCALGTADRGSSFGGAFCCLVLERRWRQVAHSPWTLGFSH